MNDYIVDVVILLVFALITFWYSRKGFVKTVLDSLSWVIAIVCAKAVSESAYDFISSNTSLLINLNESVARVVVIVLVFIAIFILLKMLIKIVDKIFKLPVLKQVNKLLGLGIGMICAIVAVIIICMVLQISVNVVYNNDYIVAVESSKIVSFVVNNEKILSSLNF